MFASDQKKYRIGIDVGTASVAVVAISLPEEKTTTKKAGDNNTEKYAPESSELLTHRLRLFDEPVDNNNGTLISKNAARRAARMARRQIARRGGRLGALRDLGYKYNLIADGDEFHIHPKSPELPVLRSDAATKQVSLPNLMRIILRLSKRRGYKGDLMRLDERQDDNTDNSADHDTGKKGKKMAEKKEKNPKPMALGAKMLSEFLEQKRMTLGQYLYHERYAKKDDYGNRLRLSTRLKLHEDADNKAIIAKSRLGGNEVFNLYASRQMVEKEFDAIWQTQTRFHPQLQGAAGAEIYQQLRKTLFHQRPLKSVAGMVGNCPLEQTLPRAPKAQIAFQKFRIEKILGDMSWGIGENKKPLSREQRAVIRNLCEIHKTVTFKTILAELGKAGCPMPTGYIRLNLQSTNRSEMHGNESRLAWHKFDTDLAQKFFALNEKTQVSVINFLADLTPDILHDEDWLRFFPHLTGDTSNLSPQQAEKRAKESAKKAAKKPEKYAQEMARRQQNQADLIEFINYLRKHPKFDRLSKMGFPTGRASYSVFAMEKLTRYMAEHNCDETSAIAVYRKEKLFLSDNDESSAPTTESQESIEFLPAAPLTGSAVVDVAMRQIRIAVNEIIRELNARPSEIVIEMARDMSLGPKKRMEIEQKIRKNTLKRAQAKAEISNFGLQPNQNLVTRFLLWEEQGRNCPYCEQALTFDEAMTSGKKQGATQIDHIIPRSLTQVGRKSSEIVLVHQGCNQEKGKRTPLQAWGSDAVRSKVIERAAKYFETHGNLRKAKLLRITDYENDNSVDGFADRQFHETAWLAKAAMAWMQPHCIGRVSVTRGGMTARLREKWGLNTIIPDQRYAEDRKVFAEHEDDPNKIGKEITKDDFEILRKYLEGHPPPKEEKEAEKAANQGIDFTSRIYKRIDHRHHLIDALVIAMTSRAMFQFLATKEKEWRENEPVRIAGESDESYKRRREIHYLNPPETPTPQLKNLHGAARHMIANPKITVKPDRYIGGRFIQATAYRHLSPEKADHDGKAVLAIRKSIISLLGANEAEMEKSLSGNIASIVNEETRRIVGSEIASRLETFRTYKDLKQSLIERPIFHTVFKQPIKNVSCKYDHVSVEPLDKYGKLPKDSQAIQVFHGKDAQHVKYYLREGYAYLEYQIENGKVKMKPEADMPKSVSNYDAEKSRHQPKTAKTKRIYKKDTLWYNPDGKTATPDPKDLFVVKEIHEGGKLLLIHIYETRSKKQLKSADGLRTVTGKSLIDYELVPNERTSRSGH